MLSDQASQGSFPAPGRPPEDNGGQLIPLDRVSQWPTGSHHFVLPDKVIEVSGAHSFSKRNLASPSLSLRRREQVSS
jgi:hypothetical protein